ncbi:hypothetical protein TSUD_351820 [Trifolium subterraneum]|uniref:TIR domain-containing protein n=1 Tax=Trifolium subterraneum TaxID=3900 RepID=A0A2Z6NWZ9_TRISU|nr:hypothetical protein TSUD_351820 [Trifolium subterraneum]
MSSSSQRIYDVFLSFREADTGRNFVSHLSQALSNAGIKVYIDNRLDGGTVLELQLLQAIRGSRISILVFSETYGKCRFCLKELEQIMKCRRNVGQIIMPIFYEVDPSDVRHQMGSFGILDLQDTVKKDFREGKRWKWKMNCPIGKVY